MAPDMGPMEAAERDWIRHAPWILVASTLLYLWPVVWWLGPSRRLGSALILLNLLLCLQYVRRGGAEPVRWGFSGKDLFPGLRWALMVTTPMLIGIFYAGLRLGSLTGREQPWLDLLYLFAWALAQQFALQTVLLQALRERLPAALAVPAAAVLFSLLHLPNPLLAPLTFVGGLLWCAIYMRHPNLIPLALSHSLCSLMVLASLPRSITGGMRVGYAWFLLS